MKKIILVAAMVLGFAVAASAQPRAIGVRGGLGAGISYQHTVGANFIDADLFFGNGLNVAGTYNWTLMQPNWTSRGEWGVYAGPGAALGLGIGEVDYLNLAVAAEVGLEYTFWFPLQLSVDFRQHIGFSRGENPLWTPSSIALSVRYRF